jgi:hypothetical protein
MLHLCIYRAQIAITGTVQENTKKKCGWAGSAPRRLRCGPVTGKLADKQDFSYFFSNSRAGVSTSASP